jgi:tetratricopeptide (TPR) repeat protein
MHRKLLEAVVAGDLEPEVAAVQAHRFGRLSPADLEALDRRITRALADGGGGSGGEARAALARTGRFAVEASLLIGDEVAAARSALTLAETLAGDPAAVEERAGMMERAVQALAKLGTPAPTMAELYRRATAARWDVYQYFKSRESLLLLIDSGDKALDLFGRMPDLSSQILWELHMMVGTAFNELPSPSDAELAASVHHLGEACALARSGGEIQRFASTQNNLANALRALGERRRDADLLERAAALLLEVLPFRTDARDLERSVRNLSSTRAALTALTALAAASSARPAATAPSAPGAAGVPGIHGDHGETPPFEAARPGADALEAHVAAGERYLARAQAEKRPREKTDLLLRSVEHLDAVTAGSPQAPSQHQQARAELGIGVALNERTSIPEAVVGICFLQAARRRLETTADGERMASSAFHLGMAFSSIPDLPGHADDLTRLHQATALFQQAESEYRAAGRQDLARHSQQLQAACLDFATDPGAPAPPVADRPAPTAGAATPQPELQALLDRLCGD